MMAGGGIRIAIVFTMGIVTLGGVSSVPGGDWGGAPPADGHRPPPPGGYYRHRSVGGHPCGHL